MLRQVLPDPGDIYVPMDTTSMCMSWLAWDIIGVIQYVAQHLQQAEAMLSAKTRTNTSRLIVDTSEMLEHTEGTRLITKLHGD